MARATRWMLVCGSLLSVAPAPASALGRSRLEALFGDANALKDAEACEAALLLYAEVTTAAEPALAALAHYNAGVCCEELGRPEPARAHYSSILDGRPKADASLRADASFRRAVLDVVAGIDAASTRADLRVARRLSWDSLDRSVIDLQTARLDALARRRGAARRLERAASRIDAADLHEGPPDRRGRPLDWYRAEAAVVRGDLLSRFAREIPLTLVAPRPLIARLRARGDALTVAQGHYVEAVSLGTAPWPQAALLALGNAYRDAATAIEAVHAEAANPAGSGRPRGGARVALAAWLAPRRVEPWRSSADAYGLCQAAERELGGAGEIEAACAQGLAETISRIRRLDPELGAAEHPEPFPAP